MYKQFYAGMELSHLPLFALGLFIVLFLGVCVRTFGVRRGSDFAGVAALPLEDGAAPREDTHG